MMEFILDRAAAGLIGLVLGLIIAVSLMVFVIEGFDQWWLLLVIPAACGIVSALVGDRAVEVFKHVATWGS